MPAPVSPPAGGRTIDVTDPKVRRQIEQKRRLMDASRRSPDARPRARPREGTLSSPAPGNHVVRRWVVLDLGTRPSRDAHDPWSAGDDFAIVFGGLGQDGTGERAVTLGELRAAAGGELGRRATLRLALRDGMERAGPSIPGRAVGDGDSSPRRRRLRSRRSPARTGDASSSAPPTATPRACTRTTSRALSWRSRTATARCFRRNTAGPASCSRDSSVGNPPSFSPGSSSRPSRSSARGSGSASGATRGDDGRRKSVGRPARARRCGRCWRGSRGSTDPSSVSGCGSSSW